MSWSCLEHCNMEPFQMFSLMKQSVLMNFLNSISEACLFSFLPVLPSSLVLTRLSPLNLAKLNTYFYCRKAKEMNNAFDLSLSLNVTVKCMKHYTGVYILTLILLILLTSNSVSLYYRECYAICWGNQRWINNHALKELSGDSG